MAFLCLFTGSPLFSFAKYSKVLLPEAASEHGTGYDNLMWVFLWYYLFCANNYPGTYYITLDINTEEKKVKKHYSYADNDRLEFIWTIIPVIVLAGLIIWGLYTWTDIMDVNDDDDPLMVELYAQQFNWKARYGGDDNVLGEAKCSFD